MSTLTELAAMLENGNINNNTYNVVSAVAAPAPTNTTNAAVFECYAAPAAAAPVAAPVASAPRKPVQVQAADDDGYMAALLADADRVAAARKPATQQPVAKPAPAPTPAYQRRTLTIVNDAAMDEIKGQPGFDGFGRYFILSKSEYNGSLHNLARPEWVDQWVCYAYFMDVPAVEQPAVAVAAPAEPTKAEKRKPLAACRRPRAPQKQDAASMEPASEQPTQPPCKVTQFESPSKLVIAPAWMAYTPFFDARMAFAL